MSFFFHLHSFWRWVVLVVGVMAVAKAFIGWLRKADFGHLDDQLGMVYTIALDVQVLLGLIIWIGRGWAALIPQVMSNPGLRFIAVEHPILMVLAVVVAHVGRSLSRKGGTGAQHRPAAVFYLLSLLLILSAIPWDRLAR